ncbi:hypothetical protein [Paraburkholderia sp. J11-2]|uniref:hypothetical protein n=1 Tax=Paraburkholderia sp. J11-2 TaxID=2805431 RepID=UPI002AB67E3A|nr:hypothetical protein [Paraburkholderia sp. J11-2]
MSLDVYLTDGEGAEIYSANITHNLGAMAREAGIYMHLWRPDEISVTKASQLIEALQIGLADMVRRPSHYEQFNAPNGWGKYENFVPWIAKYLEACIANPDAIVGVWR